MLFSRCAEFSVKRSAGLYSQRFPYLNASLLKRNDKSKSYTYYFFVVSSVCSVRDGSRYWLQSGLSVCACVGVWSLFFGRWLVNYERISVGGMYWGKATPPPANGEIDSLGTVYNIQLCIIY